MFNNYVRVATAAPEICVADPMYNAAGIIAAVERAAAEGVQVLVLPELALTGATAQDLLAFDSLISATEKAVGEILEKTGESGVVVALTVPMMHQGRLYNAALVMQGAEILGAVPKMCGDSYELRTFTPGFAEVQYAEYCGQMFPFGADMLFEAQNNPNCVLGVEIGADLWSLNPPSVGHALAGASVILNPAAETETVGKGDFRRTLLNAHTARLVCAYAYANAGKGESTQDNVYAGHCLIAEYGRVLGESPAYGDGWTVQDIDVDFLAHERRRTGALRGNAAVHARVKFELAYCEKDKLCRWIDTAPFIPADPAERARRCEEILNIQAHGLAKRIKHTWSKTAVLGLSGGLDSTLALIATVKAFDILGKDRKDILTVTMPCFGTTSRTRSNAEKMAEGYGVSFKTVNIAAAVKQHFEDIGQSMDNMDVTFENGQARERTQVLMDIANQMGGMVVGTGDLSEIALGWATYNGDHMSMYAVNADLPKTLIRHVVEYEAATCGSAEVAAVLRDVLDTPVSPELLPPKDGEIAQKTEDLVGPYELHDFFLYHLVRRGAKPEVIFGLAKQGFAGVYDEATIEKWLRTFVRRFFNQQFKRSCIPDGPKVGSVALSPRGDWRMPSDAMSSAWQF